MIKVHNNIKNAKQQMIFTWACNAISIVLFRLSDFGMVSFWMDCSLNRFFCFILKQNSENWL